jgi:DNA-binding LytR/AlgR family response regulator
MALPTISGIIADSDPLASAQLAAMLGQLWPDLEIQGIASNGIDACRQIASLDPDVVFLGLQLSGIGGVEVAHGIEGDTQVVFIATGEEYAASATGPKSVDTLIKPITLERLTLIVERCRCRATLPIGGLAHGMSGLPPSPWRPKDPLRWIRATSGEHTHVISVDDVLCFDANEKYTIVVVAEGEHLIRTPIRDLARQLDPDQFWQIHRSTILNLRHVSGARRDERSRLLVRLRNHPRELKVSRAYVHLFHGM